MQSPELKCQCGRQNWKVGHNLQIQNLSDHHQEQNVGTDVSIGKWVTIITECRYRRQNWKVVHNHQNQNFSDHHQKQNVSTDVKMAKPVTIIKTTHEHQQQVTNLLDNSCMQKFLHSQFPVSYGLNIGTKRQVPELLGNVQRVESCMHDCVVGCCCTQKAACA